MNGIKLVALALIVAGSLELAYGSLRYMNAGHRLDLGSVEQFVATPHTAKIPGWVGVAAIAAGAALLLYSTTKRR
jgi:hypothetical protein